MYLDRGDLLTKDEVVKLLTLIERVYKVVVVKEETIIHWFDYCQYIDGKEVTERLMTHISKSPYPPNFRDIAVFRKHAIQSPDSLKIWIKEERESGNKVAWREEYTIRK